MMHASTLRGGLRPLAPRRAVAARAARPRRDGPPAPPPAPVAVAAPAPNLFLETGLRSFLLGVGAGALFETVHVVSTVSRRHPRIETRPVGARAARQAAGAAARAQASLSLSSPPPPRQPRCGLRAVVGEGEDGRVWGWVAAADSAPQHTDAQTQFAPTLLQLFAGALDGPVSAVWDTLSPLFVADHVVAM